MPRFYLRDYRGNLRLYPTQEKAIVGAVRFGRDIGADYTVPGYPTLRDRVISTLVLGDVFALHHDNGDMAMGIGSEEAWGQYDAALREQRLQNQRCDDVELVAGILHRAGFLMYSKGGGDSYTVEYAGKFDNVLIATLHFGGRGMIIGDIYELGPDCLPECIQLTVRKETSQASLVRKLNRAKRTSILVLTKA